MSDTLIWISGATGGIGLGLAQTAPFPGARIINLSRRDHPDYETVQFDLTQPDTYAAVGDSFARELANFKGRRAIFIHNALYHTAGFVAEADPREIAKAIQANAAAPLILGDLFLRAVKPGYESGLVLMSSATARMPYPGHASYCAAKAAVEIWVRVVKLELAARGRDTWVTAVRPGFVQTPGTVAAALLPAEVYPAASYIAAALAKGGPDVYTPEFAARQIWEGLQTRKHEPLLHFGAPVTAAD
jgi:benzil reductase ((S)-benzoin forming)